LIMFEMWKTVYIVFVRASEDNCLSGVVAFFFRGFEWFGTGFGRGVIICVMD